ncbi:MAG TPA: protein kinase, partial [Burkholderiales bacterium]|nr:protein kinase [Burkholderiales bacterium]
APVPDIKTLGRYNIERTLGKGAMGVVYEGVDPRLGRRVAIKTILKSHLDEDTAKDYSMRFVREAQAVARLNHPHIVQVYDFGEEGDIAYLVMEFIKGKELKTFFDAAERFDLKEAVRIMAELCDALDFAHNAGIIHRDIKPANVMIDAQGRTKLTDFGVARVQDSDKTSVERTQAGTMVGTPAYMSPEQITGGNIDKRTDVFSAGIILYQFLTGEKPFTGSGAWTIAKKIIQEEPPLPSSLNNAITPLFDAVVNKALAKNVEQRYQSARDLGVALKRALEGKGEEDDSDKTVVGSMSDIAALKPAPAIAKAPAQESQRTSGTGTQAGGNQEVELEFWRAIKDGNDPDDFELYVQQFPTGIYAALAKRKIAKLRGVPLEESSVKAKEQEKKEAEDAARREAEVKSKLEAEKARLEAEMARKEEEYKKREAEAEAKRQAAEKARQEAEAKAKQETAAELARREAEYKKRETEAEAKRQAEAKARADAEAKARLEAEAKAKADAEARAKRDAEDKAKRDAELKVRAEAEAKQKAEFAKREAELKKRVAEAESHPGGKKQAIKYAAIVGGVVLAIAGAVIFILPKEDPAAAAKIEAIQKQLEEAKKRTAELEQAKQKEEQARMALEKARKAEDDARKSGDLAKQKELEQARKVAEVEAKKQSEAMKAAEQQKMAAEKKADESKKADAKKAEEARLAKSEESKKADAQKQAEAQRQAAERAAADKAAAEKFAAEKAALEAERARLAADKAQNEKLAAEAKAAAEKAERDRLAAEKARQGTGTQVVSTAPSSSGAAPASGGGAFQNAAALEGEGKGKEAVKAYITAARGGSCEAAKRLGDIFDKGQIGQSRDYAESLKWYNFARTLGTCDVPVAKSRS